MILGNFTKKKRIRNEYILNILNIDFHLYLICHSYLYSNIYKINLDFPEGKKNSFEIFRTNIPSFHYSYMKCTVHFVIFCQYVCLIFIFIMY